MDRHEKESRHGEQTLTHYMYSAAISISMCTVVFISALCKFSLFTPLLNVLHTIFSMIVLKIYVYTSMVLHINTCCLIMQAAMEHIQGLVPAEVNNNLGGQKV